MKNILILTEPDTTISQKAKRIVINTNGTIQELKTKDISSCIYFGNIQFTTQALRLLANEGIQVTNLTYDGELKFVVLSAYHINYDLRIRQYESYLSEKRRLEIAKFIVSEKVRLSYEFISKNKSRHKKFSIRTISKEFDKIKEKVKKAENTEELIGYEGNFSKIYFNYLKELSKGKIRFIERSKRPPRDEANALLSFIYTLTYSLISGITFAAGFDPYVGFLHKEDYGRNSFALDILELYRAKFCDKLFINITNRNLLTTEHFEKTKEGGFMMNSEGKYKFFKIWQKTIYDYDKPSKSIIYDIQKKLNIFSKLFREKKSE